MRVPRWLKKLRESSRAPKSSGEASLYLGEMEGLLNRTAIVLFERYRHELLKQPPLYIVPAVWGAAESGELDEVQVAMHRTLAPVLRGIQRRLSIAGQMGPDAAATLDYLLKDLLIYKMAYMVQYFMNACGPTEVVPREERGLLHALEPVGRA